MQTTTGTNVPAATSLASREVHMPDLPELKTELQWCLAHGEFGQRTGLALQWALDALNEIEETEVKT